MDKVVQRQTIDGIGILTLNRPDTLNALDWATMRALLEAVREIADDDEVRCVVLTGAGRGFCSGGDVRAITRAAKDRVDAGTDQQPRSRSTTESRTRWLRRSVETSRLLREMPKPTIAMINGPCAGAGLSLAAACDMRFAATSAIFRAAFTTNGMPGDYGGTWLWTQILGTAKARQLYLIDEKYTAEQALQFGLVDRLFPDIELLDNTMSVARALANMPPSGLAYAKANLNAAPNQSFAEALDFESLNMMLARNALVAQAQA
jgi:2-(1,2-epoxy-1,2-dihydrophenyl)acetyl-CoA isomerase